MKCIEKNVKNKKNSKKSIMSSESKSTLKSMDHFNMENYMVADALSWTELIGIYGEIR
jgi:hypothetical protein